MFDSISLFSPVRTTPPPLPTALNPSATISRSAAGRQDRGVGHLPTGQVGDRLLASSVLAKAWVAPSSMAFSRLFANGSIAMTFFAPARGTLYGVDADAADADDDDGLARA